jgi:hypothetical protein
MSVRQSELFAGQDWTVLYRAFVQVNFNASDPSSINAALREYLQANYPEDFNDWVESSEFVAIIELLSWLAGTLAFKTDIAARENFLETAESRESILRLARFLSYNPSRNRPARGIVKLIEVMTDDAVTDTLGASLANVPIQWDDADDPDWFEKFVTVLNSAFVTTNPFGTPLKQGTVSGARTQLYRINNRIGDATYGFSSDVSGQSMDFEVCNVDFSDAGGIFERSPNPDAAMHLLHMSDGGGNASNRTGFFLYFRQGSTRRETVLIPSPVENYTYELVATDVNQDDVWVQTIDDDGTILADWKKVPVVLNENITYNGLPLSDRNIFSAITLDEDRVMLRFSDGRFGTAPSGLLNFTYRVSNGLQYQIRPQEIDRVRLPFRYVNRSGVARTLFLTFSLFEGVSNATTRETEEQIQQRAPLVYASQGRMVSGEDYNTFPLQTNLAIKIKAVNRNYAGHSRYTDLHDPTGAYSDLFIAANDGIMFLENAGSYAEVPNTLNRTPREIIDLHISPILRGNNVKTAMQAALLARDPALPSNLTWTPTTTTSFGSTGSFSASNILLRPGAAIQFTRSGTTKWATVMDVRGSVTDTPITGQPGPVTLSEPIVANSVATRIVPGYSPGLTTDVLATIDERISLRLPFSLWYDYTDVNGHWSVRDPAREPGPAVFAGNAIQVMTVNYVSGMWRIACRGMRYVFESEKSVEWYHEGRRSVDSGTGEQKIDTVRIMRINEDRNNSSGHALRRDFDLAIGRLWYYPDGSAEPRRVIVSFMDSDEDGQVDDPDTFERVVSAEVPDSYLFWGRTPDGTFLPKFDVVAYDTEDLRDSDAGTVGTVAYQVTGNVASRDGTFWLRTTSGWVQDLDQTYKAARGRGPNVAAEWVTATERVVPVGDRIIFNWLHYAPGDHRLDPCPTNTHDIFVLSSEYDFQIRQWIRNGAVLADIPRAPSELDLRLSFQDTEEFKIFSDGIVWRPVRYKMLFGSGAIDELKAQFKVIKLPNSPFSDGEIRSRVIRAVNDYFDARKWDFGETFFYTELAAYIHQQLAGVVASCVIVPSDLEGSFGDGFEVRCRPDEMFISTAQVGDVQIIASNTTANLRIR